MPTFVCGRITILEADTRDSGFQPAEAWSAADHADDELGQSLDFAFSEEIGYLTSCPTNTGTGLRASVLIHLPALVLLEEIQRVLKSIMQVGLNVRGLYGEHSEIMGNLFQISNQTTLGRSERDSIESLERVTRQIIETEERARERMLRDARTQLEDKVWRAYGTLRYCRSIQAKEVINLCSAVRLGAAFGIPGLCPLRPVNELLVLTQPTAAAVVIIILRIARLPFPPVAGSDNPRLPMLLLAIPNPSGRHQPLRCALHCAPCVA